jgi:GTP-binding protein
MTQTKFVLTKALQRKLVPIVVMNKIDRETARPELVENDLLELFIGLDADDKSLEYPIIYASAKQGYASLDPDAREGTVLPLLDMMIDKVPPPSNDPTKPFSMIVTQIENDKYVGKCYLGKIHSGVVKVGDVIKTIDTEGKVKSESKCSKIIRRQGLDQEIVEEAVAGDIISIAGLQDSFVNFTICAPEVTEPLPFIPVDQPTISMLFYVNDSPLAGIEGKKLTSQVIKKRLLDELETNVSLQLIENNDAFEIKGRGELQMGVLIETMRREGFELSVSPPKVLFKITGEGKDKQTLEPIEEVTIDCDHEHAGTIIEKLTGRKGEMKSYNDQGERARIIFEIPTRGLLGYPAEFKNDTHGQGVLNHMLLGFEPFRGPIEKTRKGSLISSARFLILNKW